MSTTNLPAAVLTVLFALASTSPAAPPKPVKPHTDLERKLSQAVEHMESAGEEDGAEKVKAVLGDLEAAAAKSPKDARLQFLVGKAHFYLGGDDDALAAYDRAIALSPKDAEFHFMKGVLLNYREEPEEAAAELRKATELNPKNADYWFELGTTHARADRRDDAAAAFERAVAADPKHARSILMLGVMKLEAGDEPAALAMFEKAAKADPGYANAHRNVGQLKQNQGRHAEAVKAFQAVLKLEPNDWRARAKLVQEYQALGKANERDAARAELLELHAAGKVDADLYCREQFKHGKERVMAFEHFELKGERALRYVFHVLEEGTDDTKYKISLGSYETTTQIARELKEIGPDERAYHLDGYDPGGEHRTFAHFNAEPSYEDTRKIVTQVLDGEADPVSGSKPKKDGGGVDVEIDVDE